MSQPNQPFRLVDGQWIEAAPSPAKPDAGAETQSHESLWQCIEFYIQNSEAVGMHEAILLRDFARWMIQYHFPSDQSAALATAKADKLELLRRWTESEAALAEARREILELRGKLFDTKIWPPDSEWNESAAPSPPGSSEPAAAEEIEKLIKKYGDAVGNDVMASDADWDSGYTDRKIAAYNALISAVRQLAGECEMHSGIAISALAKATELQAELAAERQKVERLESELRVQKATSDYKQRW